MTAAQWQMVETLFHAALELPADGRAAFVAGACPEDGAVAGAVLRMLAADAAPGDEIRQAVRSAVKDWMAAR